MLKKSLVVIGLKESGTEQYQHEPIAIDEKKLLAVICTDALRDAQKKKLSFTDKAY